MAAPLGPSDPEASFPTARRATVGPVVGLTAVVIALAAAGGAAFAAQAAPRRMAFIRTQRWPVARAPIHPRTLPTVGLQRGPLSLVGAPGPFPGVPRPLGRLRSLRLSFFGAATGVAAWLGRATLPLRLRPHAAAPAAVDGTVRQTPPPSPPPPPPPPPPPAAAAAVLDDDDRLGLTDLRPEEMVLQRLHPHPRDALIEFDAPTHTYRYRTRDGRTVEASLSCTGLVHACFPPFDEDRVIDQMMRRRSWPLERYVDPETGATLTKEQIKAQWGAKSLDARSRGTAMHAEIERLLNGHPVEGGGGRELALFRRFQADVLAPRGIRPHRTEMAVFDEDLELAGSIDFVGVDDDGVYHICDWKRSRDFMERARATRSDEPCGRWPLRHLPHCTSAHYALQLNIYAKLLEDTYGWKVGGLWLGILHPDQPQALAVPVAPLPAEVECLFALRRLEVAAARKVGAPPAPDSRHAMGLLHQTADPLVADFSRRHAAMLQCHEVYFGTAQTQRLAWLRTHATTLTPATAAVV